MNIEETKQQEDILRERLLKQIDDLRDKIANNEPFPEASQDYESLCTIEEYIEDALHNWYY